jgi:hypothetical protein
MDQVDSARSVGVTQKGLCPVHPLYEGQTRPTLEVAPPGCRCFEMWWGRCDTKYRPDKPNKFVISATNLHTTHVDQIEPAIHAVGENKALSSGHLPPNWQVPESLIASCARRVKKGNDKGYPIHNWRSGLDDALFLRDRSNHAVRHLLHLVNGNMSIDDAQGNVDALSWFCAMINEALRLHPETVAKAFYSEPRQEVVTPTPEETK